MNLRDTIRDPKRNVIIYTLVPPPADAQETERNSTVDALEQLFGSVDAPIDAFNIPEVRQDARTPRQAFRPKMPPREFARLIRARMDDPPEIIVDRGIVEAPWEQQRPWLRETARGFGIKNLVLVGGASSGIDYPGPPVPEAARRIAQDNELDLFLGGIAIPTRRRDEPQRLAEKTRGGIEFFLSQILYEPEYAKRLLIDYHRRCHGDGLVPGRIFLSFAPVASRSDMEMLKGWGVEIPESVEGTVLGGWLGTAWRSIDVCEKVLGEILEFARSQQFNVPLGLNIEHVRARNFEVSWQLVERLAAL